MRGDRPVVGGNRPAVVAVTRQHGPLRGRSDRTVGRERDRQVVDPGSPDDDEYGDREPETVGDTADRPFDNEAEADEEQGRGEHREHRRVLRRAGVPGHPCRCQRLLLQDLALRLELERAELAEQLARGETLSRLQVLPTEPGCAESPAASARLGAPASRGRRNGRKSCSA